MLSSLTELNNYIDKAQLTEDLGGTLDYCHSRWLSHRTVSNPFSNYFNGPSVVQFPVSNSMDK